MSPMGTMSSPIGDFNVAGVEHTQYGGRAVGQRQAMLHTLQGHHTPTFVKPTLAPQGIVPNISQEQGIKYDATFSGSLQSCQFGLSVPPAILPVAASLQALQQDCRSDGKQTMLFSHQRRLAGRDGLKSQHISSPVQHHNLQAKHEYPIALNAIPSQATTSNLHGTTALSFLNQQRMGTRDVPKTQQHTCSPLQHPDYQANYYLPSTRYTMPSQAQACVPPPPAHSAQLTGHQGLCQNHGRPQPPARGVHSQHASQAAIRAVGSPLSSGGLPYRSAPRVPNQSPQPTALQPQVDAIPTITSQMVDQWSKIVAADQHSMAQQLVTDTIQHHTSHHTSKKRSADGNLSAQEIIDMDRKSSLESSDTHIRSAESDGKQARKGKKAEQRKAAQVKGTKRRQREEAPTTGSNLHVLSKPHETAAPQQLGRTGDTMGAIDTPEDIQQSAKKAKTVSEDPFLEFLKTYPQYCGGYDELMDIAEFRQIGPDTIVSTFEQDLQRAMQQWDAIEARQLLVGCEYPDQELAAAAEMMIHDYML